MAKNNYYLKKLNLDNKSKFEVLFELQNEGVPINYCENFEGTFEEIVQKAKSTIIDLKKVLPKGRFEIKIEDLFDDDTFVFVNENTFHVSKNLSLMFEISS